VTVKFYHRSGLITAEWPQFDLVLTKRINYATLAQKAGERLGVDPTHIRFSPVNANNGKPKAPIKHTSNYNLAQMLSQGFSAYAGQTSASRNDALYYEVLECSLQELENRKVIKVTYLPATDEHEKEHILELLVPKTGNVQDMIALLQKKCEVDDKTAQRIRVYEVHNKKIHKDFPLSYPVTNFNEYADIVAEPRLEEELGPLGEDERLINCFHYDREIGKSFGYPFVFLAKAVSNLSLRQFELTWLG
jgi:ubiquitin carboxyl-terminal hydrolase 7